MTLRDDLEKTWTRMEKVNPRPGPRPPPPKAKGKKLCPACGLVGCPVCDPRKAAEQKMRPLAEMPFGKHKGEHIEDVPTSYLTWLVEQEWCEEKFYSLYDAALIEIEYRKMWGDQDG